MIKSIPRSLPLIFAFALLTSCDSIQQEAELRLQELTRKTESLDSLINGELDKVKSLDSLIIREGEKVKQLDSLIEKSTTKIDSISKEVIPSLTK
jgi:peptidoglycan hydrolase CwlO-like protein